MSKFTEKLAGVSLCLGLAAGMLVPVRALAAIAVASTTNKTQGNLATMTIAPAAVTGGNILVAHILANGTTTPPTGPNASWVLLTTSTTITGNCVLTTWTHTVTAGETSSYVWTEGAKIDWAGGITQYS